MAQMPTVSRSGCFSRHFKSAIRYTKVNKVIHFCCPNKEAAMGNIVSAAADPLYCIPIWNFSHVIN